MVSVNSDSGLAGNDLVVVQSVDAKKQEETTTKALTKSNNICL